jgi:hypothetical protein
LRRAADTATKARSTLSCTVMPAMTNMRRKALSGPGPRGDGSVATRVPAPLPAPVPVQRSGVRR